MLFANQPSAVARPDWITDCTFPDKSDLGGVKRFRSPEKFNLRGGSKAIKKLKKTVRRSELVPSSGTNKSKIPGPLAAASTAGTSTGASSAQKILDFEVYEEGALTLPLCPSSGNDGASGP